MCARVHFNPRTPQGGATRCRTGRRGANKFQSTHPARGCDKGFSVQCSAVPLFQSTHPARGCDLPRRSVYGRTPGFQSTHPARGCDFPGKSRQSLVEHFNPRTPQGGATPRHFIFNISFIISIHAPRKGVRLAAAALAVFALPISIHAPRKGVRH